MTLKIHQHIFDGMDWHTRRWQHRLVTITRQRRKERKRERERDGKNSKQWLLLSLLSHSYLFMLLTCNMCHYPLVATSFGKVHLRLGGQPIAPRQGTGQMEVAKIWCWIGQWHQQAAWNIWKHITHNVTVTIRTCFAQCFGGGLTIFGWLERVPLLWICGGTDPVPQRPVRFDSCCWWMKLNHLRSNPPSWCLWWWWLGCPGASLEQSVGFHGFQWISVMGLGRISWELPDELWRLQHELQSLQTVPHGWQIVKRNRGECICAGVFPSGSHGRGRKSQQLALCNGEICGWNCYCLLHMWRNRGWQGLSRWMFPFLDHLGCSNFQI